MNTVLDIGRLTRAEKLRAMEELWDDLTRTKDEFPSPEWHGDVLRARAARVQEGASEYGDWTEVKRRIR